MAGACFHDTARHSIVVMTVRCSGGKLCDLPNEHLPRVARPNRDVRRGAGRGQPVRGAAKCVTGDCSIARDCDDGELCDVGTSLARLDTDDAGCSAGTAEGTWCVAASGLRASAARRRSNGGQICTSTATCDADARATPAEFDGYGFDHLCGAARAYRAATAAASTIESPVRYAAWARACADMRARRDHARRDGYGARPPVLERPHAIAGNAARAGDCSGGQLCGATRDTSLHDRTMCDAQYGAGHM